MRLAIRPGNRCKQAFPSCDELSGVAVGDVAGVKLPIRLAIFFGPASGLCWSAQRMPAPATQIRLAFSSASAAGAADLASSVWSAEDGPLDEHLRQRSDSPLSSRRLAKLFGDSRRGSPADRAPATLLCRRHPYDPDPLDDCAILRSEAGGLVSPSELDSCGDFGAQPARSLTSRRCGPQDAARGGEQSGQPRAGRRCGPPLL